MHRHYARDPRTLTARYAGTCRQCGEPFERGSSIFYWPYDKRSHGPCCAPAAAAAFHAEAADEDFLAGYSR